MQVNDDESINPEERSQDFASELAEFSVNLTCNSLPSVVIEAAKNNIFDTLICATAGSSASAIKEVYSMVQEWGGTPQASILVFGDRVPAHHAAFVNGCMAHARDYDDTHDAAVLHAGVSVIPAALAAAQLKGKTNGQDLIAGVVAGLETICRLGVSTQIGIIESGFMYTALLGHFAATVAAARVLRLTKEQTINALGIAYSQVSGNHQVTRDAAHTKRMQPGFAAMSALISVQLALKGIRGVQSTFEGIDGFFRVYLRNRYDPKILREGLGQRFEFLQLSYKPYPCCRFNHSAIEAALILRADLGKKLSHIKKIRVGLNHQAFEAVCTPIEIRKSPQTVVQAQFSIPYTISVALTDGRVGLGHFSEMLSERLDIMALAQKVDPYIDPTIEQQYGRNIAPTVVSVEFDDGTTAKLTIDKPLGHPSRPMSAEDLNTKASDCLAMSAKSLAQATQSKLSELMKQLERVDDIDAVLNILIHSSD
ncbi:MAG: MmgE/PrpD family protein [Betaproteobacteria bacterium]|jgi:2-methylcitrate dehydratase PrpD